MNLEFGGFWDLRAVSLANYGPPSQALEPGPYRVQPEPEHIPMGRAAGRVQFGLGLSQGQFEPGFSVARSRWPAVSSGPVGGLRPASSCCDSIDLLSQPRAMKSRYHGAS